MSPPRRINVLLRAPMDTEQPTGPDAAPEAPEARATDSEVPERRPSKVAVFIAMAAVAIAILIVMLAPGAENPAAPVSDAKGNLTGSPNTAQADPAREGKDSWQGAPHRLTLQ